MDISYQGREVQFNTPALKIKPIRDIRKPQSVPHGTYCTYCLILTNNLFFCRKVFACSSYEAPEERRTLQAHGAELSFVGKRLRLCTLDERSINQLLRIDFHTILSSYSLTAIREVTRSPP